MDEAQLDNVEVVHAGFLSYEHQGRPADFIYSRFALHQLPDLWNGVAFARLHQVLRPGGVFRLSDMVYKFDPAEAADRIEAWCSTSPALGDGGWVRAELEEHVLDEHSTFTWALKVMMERASFTIETREYTDDGIVAAYVPRRA